MINVRPICAEKYSLIFCCYKENDVERSLEFASRFRKFLPNLEIIAVDTGHKIDFAAEPYRATFDKTMRTSNNNMEFGAYQCGLEYLRTREDFDSIRGVFFGNDTVSNKGFTVGTNLAYAAVAASVPATEAVLFGKCDSYGPQDFTIGELQSQRWVSTHLFYASKGWLERVQFRVAYNLLGQVDNRVRDLVTEASEQTFFGTRPVKAALRGGGEGVGMLAWNWS